MQKSEGRMIWYSEKVYWAIQLTLSLPESNLELTNKYGRNFESVDKTQYVNVFGRASKKYMQKSI